jgi:hypothetical protein
MVTRRIRNNDFENITYQFDLREFHSERFAISQKNKVHAVLIFEIFKKWHPSL